MQKVKIQKHEDLDQSDRFEIQFPLPEHTDPSICRDEFLRSIVEEQEIRLSSLKQGSTSRARTSGRASSRLQSFQADLESAEAMAVMQIARQRQKTRRSTAEHRLSIRLRSTMLINLNRQCQKAAIEFLSVRLLKQLRLFSRPWPGKLDEIPYNLFSWSLDHFMARLNMKQMYLDVIHRERSSEDLDCLKFRTDLHEIELLIHEIREDFREEKNICKGSFELIQNAHYVTKAPWVKALQKHNKEVVALTTMNLVGSKTSIGEINHRAADLEDLYDNATAQDPIEVRYQINWINSLEDQNLLKMAGREEKVWRELEDIRNKEAQDYVVQTHSKVMYDVMVESLRAMINDWQERYDEDLERAELKNAVARSALQKVKDDLKFYKERQEMYIRRIAEEQKVIAKELELKAEREAFQSRRSMRRSTVSHKGKRMSTAAQKEKQLSTGSQKQKRDAQKKSVRKF